MKRQTLLGLAMSVLLAACSTAPSAGDDREPRSGSAGSSAKSAASAGNGSARMSSTEAPQAGASSINAGRGAAVTSTMPVTAGASGSKASDGASAGRPASQPVVGGDQPAVGGQTQVAGAGGAAGRGMVPSDSLPSAGAGVRDADPTEATVTSPGEYTVMSYTEASGLVGGDAYGDAALAGDGSELYFPVDGMPPFAAMVIVPGFTAQRADVAPWGQFLASHGIIGLVIDTNTVGDSPGVRATALEDALESLKKENAREGSPVKGNVDLTRLGVMGWSMGGGGTWLTADDHPELKAVISLCGWITGRVGGKTEVPSLQLAVVGDPLAAGMSQPVYRAIPDSTPKMLIEFDSLDHWLANDPVNAEKQVGRFGLAWLKVHLEGDERYRQFLKTTPTGTTDFQTNIK